MSATGESSVTVRAACEQDAAAWERMRQALWPSAPGEHAGEIARYFQGTLVNVVEVLLAFDSQGGAVGVVELSIRPFAEECHSGRVAYVEGWYVAEAWRRRGVGRALLDAAADWARGQGCTEMGSDAALRNDPSRAAHQALGFEEVGQIRCFRKAL